MKKLLLFSLCSFIALAGSSVAYAQVDSADRKQKDEVYGMFLTFPFEFPIIDNGAFNDQLVAQGLPKCEYSLIKIGIGIQFEVNQKICGLSFNKTTRTHETDTGVVAAEYRSTAFNFGYDVLKSPAFSLYPYVGLKMCSSTFTYKERTQGADSVGTYLNTKLDYKEISNRRAHVDLGIGFSYQWFYMLSLRAGYLIPIEDVRWSINKDRGLGYGPDVQYRGYISFTIGLGGMYSDKEMRRQQARQADRPLFRL